MKEVPIKAHNDLLKVWLGGMDLANLVFSLEVIWGKSLIIRGGVLG